MSGDKKKKGLKLPASWPALLAVAVAAVLLVLLLKPSADEGDFFGNDPVADAEMAQAILLAQIDAAQPSLGAAIVNGEPIFLVDPETAGEGGQVPLTRDLFSPVTTKAVRARSLSDAPVKPGKQPVRSHAGSPHKLSALLIDGTKRQAMFGGHHIVEMGDEMHGYTVVAISDSSVTLRRDDETIEIKMGAK